MSIADKLQAILTVKNQIKAALIAKGASINDATPFNQYPVAIQNMATGSASSGSVDFYVDATTTYIKKLTLPTDTKIITGSLFRYAAVQEFGLPSGLLKIMSYALANNTYLKSLAIPDTVNELGEYALTACTALTYVEFPPSIVKFGRSICEGCSGLLEATVNTNATSISAYFFRNCTKLKKVTLSASISIAYDNSFISCIALTDVVAPNLSQIMDYAFYGCTALENFDFSTVTVLNNSCFYDCRAIKTINLSKLGGFNGSNFFVNMNALIDLDFGKYTGSFPQNTLVNAPVLKQLIFKGDKPNFNITAFKNLSGLKYLEFTSINGFFIYGQAFTGLTVMEAIVIRSLSIPLVMGNSSVPLFDNLPSTAKIYVQDNLVNAYKTANGWSLLADKIVPLSTFVMPVL